MGTVSLCRYLLIVVGLIETKRLNSHLLLMHSEHHSIDLNKPKIAVHIVQRHSIFYGVIKRSKRSVSSQNKPLLKFNITTLHTQIHTHTHTRTHKLHMIYQRSVNVSNIAHDTYTCLLDGAILYCSVFHTVQPQNTPIQEESTE